MAKSSQDRLALVRDYGSVAALVQNGVVFLINNPTIDTGVTGQTSYVATTPTFTLRNVGPRMLVPLYAQLYQTGTVAGATIFVNVSTLETGQFTSGTQMTPVNANQHVSQGATVLAYHTSTLPAFTTGNQRFIAGARLTQTVTAYQEYYPFEAFPTPGFCAVAPGGQLDLYTYAATTGPTWNFNIMWAELETR